MMTSSRPRDGVAGSFSNRRGHGSQLSISDPSHHVTEAIGTLYGDEDDSGSEGSGRPLSFIDGGSYNEQIQRPAHMSQSSYSRSPPQRQPHLEYESRKPLTRSISDDNYNSTSPHEDHNRSLRKSQTLHVPSTSRRSSRQYDGGSVSPVSSGLPLRDAQSSVVGSQFPLTNIDNPNDIAQELNNLQALRRMSMDVGNSIDPDMPPMALSAMPVIAPTGDDDENDPSRLLWVPARVHPELAPSEFKSFLENRVQSIRRRSGESYLSSGTDLSNSAHSSLRRNKSKLSRQIDNSAGQGAVGYVDGAERLERHRSISGGHGPELSLDELVKDPARAVQKFAQEAQNSQSVDEDGSHDMPILPMAPGMGLRRSTRTTYRKGGSLRSGERAHLSKRLTQRQQDGDMPLKPNPPPRDSSKSLTQGQYDPIAENYSWHTRGPRQQQNVTEESPASPALDSIDGSAKDESAFTTASPLLQEQLLVRTSSLSANASTQESSLQEDTDDRLKNQTNRAFPKRSSSQSAGSLKPELTLVTPDVIVEEPPPTHSNRPAAPSTNQFHAGKQTQYTSTTAAPQQQSYNDGFTSSSSLMSGDASRTDSLTVIPTFNQVDKKTDKKSKKDKDDDSASTTSKSGSAWKWFKGVTDDKDKKKEESKRAKAKALAEKASDNARLDVIQTSIDKTTPKGRESVVLDRDTIDNKLFEERKKESHRKSDSRKEKDGSIFSSIFGGSKRKEEKDKANKKNQHLQAPEEPVYKPMQADVDYSWTRFPLLEERAIYRMAHIKLANPRRPLLSQVLLSNFMYSYLAIVQAMHPQMNVPTSPQQKRLEEEARRKRQEQEYLAQQQMDGEDRNNSLEQYSYDYHRAAVQYAESESDGQVDYVDEAQIYEDDHGISNNDEDDAYDYEDSDGYGHSVKDYYQYQGNDEDRRRHGGDSMW